MTRKQRRIPWLVAHKKHRVYVGKARTPGAAARQAFRHLLKFGRIKRAPVHDHSGGFERTTIAPFSQI